MRCVFLLPLVLTVAPVFAQNLPFTCQVTSPTPLLVRMTGDSELTGDIILECIEGEPIPTFFNFTLFLNVPFTTKIMNTVTSATESLLLIDEPQPFLPNASNGCSPAYSGQVLGTTGVSACVGGSGNVYQGTTITSGGSILVNTIQWLGVPIVPPGHGGGTRIIRLTNIRSAPTSIGVPNASILAEIAMSGPSPIMVVQPPAGTPIAFMEPGLVFSSSAPSTGVLALSFKEGFGSAFKKRIENVATPLDATRQDLPGFLYCTESGFTPQFSATTPGAIGSADTGTRLLAKFDSLPPSAFLLLVPNEVTSSSGQLVAHRVFPPIAADFVGGSIPLIGGDSVVFVSGHRAEVLYEVTANAPYHGVTGCNVIESFDFDVRSIFPVPLSSVVVTGEIVPADPDPFATPSPTSPRPRFKH